MEFVVDYYTCLIAAERYVSPLLRDSSIFVKMQVFKTRENGGGAIWVAGGGIEI